ASELDVDRLDCCKRGAFERPGLAEIERRAVRESHLVDELVLVEVGRMIAARREHRSVADIVVLAIERRKHAMVVDAGRSGHPEAVGSPAPPARGPREEARSSRSASGGPCARPRQAEAPRRWTLHAPPAGPHWLGRAAPPSG